MAYLRAIYRIPLLMLATGMPLPFLWTGRAMSAVGFGTQGSKVSRFAITRWARWSCRILGVRIETAGPIPKPPFFLVANHLSYLDIVILHATVRGHFLSKSEIGSWPIMGSLAKWAGTLFIDRKNRRDVSRAIPELQAAMRGGEGVILFPEGTSTAGTTVDPFHPSLLQAPLAMQMGTHVASLHYATPAGSEPAHMSVCWWGDMPFGSHFLKMLTLRSIDAKIHFHEQIFHGEDRKALAQSARDGVLELFQPSAPESFVYPDVKPAQVS
ncbi:MAG: 1-acyl-sn-glycerol-3-phosphate acyltransferase [Planctomycetes bacterium]|nr:1-acyl-sn-glycerol-3-phosphate acyltransferase [Planctomycetota bacterium]